MSGAALLAALVVSSGGSQLAPPAGALRRQMCANQGQGHAIDQQVRFSLATRTFTSAQGRNQNVNSPGNKQQSGVQTLP